MIEYPRKGGINYVTDLTVIATITDESNWTGGSYTGSTASLNPGDVYIDLSAGIRYEFDGTNLIRNQINEIV